MIQWMLAIWSLVPLPFLNPARTSGISQFIYRWSLAWRMFSITLLACETRAIVWYFEHSLALPFFGIGMKTDPFQSCGLEGLELWGWVFQFRWHIECSTLTTSSFRIYRLVNELTHVYNFSGWFCSLFWFKVEVYVLYLSGGTEGCSWNEDSAIPVYLYLEDITFCWFHLLGSLLLYSALWILDPLTFLHVVLNSQA